MDMYVVHAHVHAHTQLSCCQNDGGPSSCYHAMLAASVEHWMHALCTMPIFRTARDSGQGLSATAPPTCRPAERLRWVSVGGGRLGTRTSSAGVKGERIGKCWPGRLDENRETTSPDVLHALLRSRRAPRVIALVHSSVSHVDCEELKHESAESAVVRA